MRGNGGGEPLKSAGNLPFEGRNKEGKDLSHISKKKRKKLRIGRSKGKGIDKGKALRAVTGGVYSRKGFLLTKNNAVEKKRSEKLNEQPCSPK